MFIAFMTEAIGVVLLSQFGADPVLFVIQAALGPRAYERYVAH